MNKFYFEFSEHEYYGLVVVSVEETDLKTKPFVKAAQQYVDTCAGESLEEVLEEAEPMLVTKEYAFMKFMYAADNWEREVKSAIDEFQSQENAALLVDSSLV